MVRMVRVVVMLMRLVVRLVVVMVMLVVKNVVYKGKLKVIYNSYKVALVFVITWTCQPIHLAPEKQHLVLAQPEDTELRL